MSAAEPSSNKCPIAFALDVFGDRWSLIILRDLVFKRKRYYSEFLASPRENSHQYPGQPPGKDDRCWPHCKQRDPDSGAKFIYTLTERGKDLIPLLLEMVVWSSKYDPQPDAPDNIIYGAPPHLLHRIATDRATLIADIINALP